MKSAAGHSLPTLDFFMLVTNRDVAVADHAIASYQKLVPALAGRFDWKLTIYANCLSEKNKRRFFERWKAYAFAEIYDNAAHCSPSDFVPGSLIYSPEGWPRGTEEGPYEGCDAIWTREFARFTSDFWATVDADFEILHPDFVERSLAELGARQNLVCMSSDYSPTRYIYESFSNTNCYLVERRHTWFCIYKKSAQCCETSHYYYQETGDDGKIYKYDSACKFQQDLKNKFSFELSSCAELDRKYETSFIHYGSFSKNKTLDAEWKISAYRIICLLSHRGVSFFEQKSLPDKIIRRVFTKLRGYLFRAIDKERTVYNFDANKLDKE